MVGNTMFNIQINYRLKDIAGSSLPFGGISISAIGDLFQLQPLMDGYIFNDMDNDEYGILAPNQYDKSFSKCLDCTSTITIKQTVRFRRRIYIKTSYSVKKSPKFFRNNYLTGGQVDRWTTCAWFLIQKSTNSL